MSNDSSSTNQKIEFDLKPADLFDNGYVGEFAAGLGEYYFSHFAARAIFNTSATNVEITAYNNEPWEVASIGVRVNGADYQNVACPFWGISSLTVNLPPGQKKVELVEGGQDKANPLANGTFLVKAAFNGPTELIPPTFTKRAVVYGDSISAGAHAEIRPFQGWSVLLRQAYGDSVIIEGWGSRALKDDGFSTAHRQQFADRLASYRPQDVILFIGTNDYGIPTNWDAASFGEAYGDFLDKLHVAAPKTTIHCYSPLFRRDEGPNNFGNSLDDYRAEIERATASRPWAVYRNGKAILSLADMAQDGIHPSTAGHARLAEAVKRDLGL